MDKFLSRKDTKIIKGIAIVLMLIHHLWGFSYRLYGGELKSIITVFDYPLPLVLGAFGRICVSLFMFLGGYGMYVSNYGKKFDLVGKVKSLYVGLWKVFVIFIPIGFLFFSNQGVYADSPEICSVFSDRSTLKLFMNFVGLEYDYNAEWWFFASYLFAILTFPLVRRLIEKKSAAVNIFLVIVGTILIARPIPTLAYNESLGVMNDIFIYGRLACLNRFTGSFWMGMVCANNGLLDRLYEGLKDKNLSNPIIDVLGWIVLILLRGQLDDTVDLFMVPLLIVLSMDLLRRCKLIPNIFEKLGIESENMWLIHSFFCYYFGIVARIVTITRWAVPSLITLIVMSYVAALLVTYFWKGIGKVTSKWMIRN